VVINKFSTLESRIQALMEIIQAMAASGLLNSDLKQAGMKNPIVSKEMSADAEIEFGEDASEITASSENESTENNEQ
jgi:hypothetical protein